MKERLAGRWREVAGPAAGAGAADGGPAGGGGDGDFVSAQQRALFALLSCYCDLLLPCRAYPSSRDPGAASAQASTQASAQASACLAASYACSCVWPSGCARAAAGCLLHIIILLGPDQQTKPQIHPIPAPHLAAGAPDPQLDAVLLHLLSHCAKAADRIKKNNERLRAAAGGEAPALDAVPKDQGFTRAKVGAAAAGSSVVGRERGGCGWCAGWHQNSRLHASSCAPAALLAWHAALLLQVAHPFPLLP